MGQHQATEGHVEWGIGRHGLEVGRIDIRPDQAHGAQPAPVEDLAGLPQGLDVRVEPHHRPRRPDQFGQHQQRAHRPAAHVDRAVAGLEPGAQAGLSRELGLRPCDAEEPLLIGPATVEDIGLPRGGLAHGNALLPGWLAALGPT